MTTARRHRNRWGFLFAFFAVYLQFVLPVGHAIAASYSSDDMLPGRTIVCTAYGLRHIDLETGKDVTPVAEQVLSNCPICLSIEKGSKALPVSDVSETLLLNTVPVVHGNLVSKLPDHALNTGYLSRAPPSGVLQS